MGAAFEGRSLKDLLIEAIRYGEQPEVRAKLDKVIEGALDTDHLREIMTRHALVEQHMDLDDLYSIKEEMEKAEARKLQPYFIRAFFTAAFSKQGSELRPRETGRYEIRHVPARIRERDRVIGETRTPVLKKYERICFEKQYVRATGKPMASLVHPAHPLMAALTDLVLETHQPKLKQGTVLVDPNDEGSAPRVLVMLQHSVREATGDPARLVSQRLQFIELDESGKATYAGWAPHLDLEPLQPDDKVLIKDVLESDWIDERIEALALRYATEKIVPEHYDEIRDRRERQTEKVLSAVNERLVKEINHWSSRYIKLSQDVAAGKQPRMQPENAKRRAEELTARLEQRKRELDQQRHVVSATPVIVGVALVIPQGLLAQKRGEPVQIQDAEARTRIERIAMQAVTAAEQSLGHQVFDVSAEKCGWDITARPPLQDGKMLEDRHIEVKGRVKGATTVTISRNEIMYGLNQTNKFILAIVLVDGETHEGPFYIKQPFENEPDFGIASSNYQLNYFLDKSITPELSIDIKKSRKA